MAFWDEWGTGEGPAITEDTFSGGGGSSNHGTPTTTGPGEGKRGYDIMGFLHNLTGLAGEVGGAVNSFSRRQGNPSNVERDRAANGWQKPALIAAGVVLGLAALYFVLKRK